MEAAPTSAPLNLEELIADVERDTIYVGVARIVTVSVCEKTTIPLNPKCYTSSLNWKKEIVDNYRVPSLRVKLF